MIGKKFEAKRNHHYVWAYYLRSWSQDRKNVWHTTPTGKVHLDSIRSLSKQEDFYKAGPLTAEHVEVIRQYSSKSPKHLQEQQMRFLERFLEIQAFEKIPAMGSIKAEIDEVVHVLRCNTLEDRHALHEREARPVVSSLASGDFSILAESNNLLTFLVFVGHQISRTRAFKESCLATKPEMIKMGAEAIKVFERMDECWWFLSYMFGMNIGWSLYSDRSCMYHCLLMNETETDFITSDQPVINAHPDLIDGDFTPLADHVCDFFYPISPRAAFMVNNSNRFSSGVTKVSESFVQKVNQKIAKRSDISIFGTNQSIVDIHRPLVGTHQKAVRKHFSG